MSCLNKGTKLSRLHFILKIKFPSITPSELEITILRKIEGSEGSEEFSFFKNNFEYFIIDFL